MSSGAEAKVTFKAFNQEYKQKINENVNAGKLLKQDLKLTQEQLKNTGTNVDKLSATLTSLEKQYTLQKSTTEQTRNQLELVKKQFGENSVEAQKMEKALKSAEITEQQLANKINTTKNSLEQAESAQSGYTAKVTKLEQEQRDLELSSEHLASEYKLLQETTLKNAGEAEKFAAAQKYVSEQSELAEKKIDSMEQQLSEVRKEYGDNSKEAKEMEIKVNEAKVAFANLEGEAKELSGGLSKTGDAAQSLGEKLDASNLMSAAEALSGIGDKLKEIGRYAQNAYREVAEGEEVITTKTGATGSAAESMMASYKKLTNSMVVDSFEDVGSAIGEMNTQFGFTDEQLEQTSENLLKFVRINKADISKTAIDSRKAIEAYNLSYDDFNHVLDVTTKVAQNTGQSVDKLFDNAIKGAPQIKALGLSFDEGVQLLGQLEQAGVDSGATLSGLSKATVLYAKDNKSLAQGLNELQDKIKNATSETEAINAASEIFGSKGGPRMADAIKRGALNLEDLASIATESNGTVAETFENILTPIDAQQLAMQNLKNVMADLGKELALVLEPILTALIPLIQGFANWFSNLPGPVKSLVIIIGILIVAFTALMPIIAALVVSVGILASPWTLVVIAVLAVIAILIYLYVKFEWVREGIKAFILFLKDVFVIGFDFIVDTIKGYLDATIQNFMNFFNVGKKIFNGFIDFFVGVFTGDWKKAWHGLSDIVSGIFDGFIALLKTPLNYMIGLLNAFLKGLNNIKLPKWVPGIGGKGFNIHPIPLLAKGGSFINGAAIAGEAGPELITARNGVTKVTPLSANERSSGMLGKLINLFQGKGNVPILQGLQEAATLRINQTETNQSDNKRLEYLLETLIEVVEAKKITYEGMHRQSPSGFEKFDSINRAMASSEAMINLGFN
ncbi:phage tail tape measure protein [Enterococcus faecalis]|uniref:phage tail tape measure protein n=1 Tax=Enterococcus faecalis TaxID=1351 RepID=UPI0040432F03